MKTKNYIYFKPKKYKNVNCIADGYRFDSRREADYYGQLKMEKRAGLILDFERQVEFPLFAWVPMNFERQEVCRHRVDFLVTLPDFRKEVREVKGFATDIWNLKRKLFEANYPEIEYKVVR